MFFRRHKTRIEIEQTIVRMQRRELAIPEVTSFQSSPESAFASASAESLPIPTAPTVDSESLPATAKP